MSHRYWGSGVFAVPLPHPVAVFCRVKAEGELCWKGNFVQVSQVVFTSQADSGGCGSAASSGTD